MSCQVSTSGGGGATVNKFTLVEADRLKSYPGNSGGAYGGALSITWTIPSGSTVGDLTYIEFPITNFDRNLLVLSFGFRAYKVGNDAWSNGARMDYYGVMGATNSLVVDSISLDGGNTYISVNDAPLIQHTASGTTSSFYFNRSDEVKCTITSPGYLTAPKIIFATKVITNSSPKVNSSDVSITFGPSFDTLGFRIDNENFVTIE